VSFARAFSLVELLVVIMTIVLLMALLAPGLHLATQKAQVVFCGSNQHAIGVALTQYLIEHNRWFPQIRNYGALLGNRGVSEHYGSQKHTENDRPLNRYLGYTEGPVRAAQCPADQGDVLTYDSILDLADDNESPAVYTPTEHAYTGYGSSYQEAFRKPRWGVQAVFGSVGSPGFPPSPSLRMDHIERANNKILLGDWPIFGDRRLNSPRTQWHHEGERRLNVLFADMHSEFYLFPNGEMEKHTTKTKIPDPSFFWW
jgi:type II secretory pathway pseudopilin PulG